MKFSFQFYAAIVNCHNTCRKKGKAVPYAELCKIVSDSTGKAKATVITHVDQFMKICPGSMTRKTINKADMVLGHYNKHAPDYDGMEAAIKTELDKKKRGEPPVAKKELFPDN